MSLSTNITDLATRIATENKSLRTLLNGNQATNGALATTAKGNLVAAINELKTALDALSGSAAGINDAASSTGSTYSSAKTHELLDALKDELLGEGAAAALDTIGELAAALGNNANSITDIMTSLGNRVRFDAAQTLTAPQQAQVRTNIGAASAADVGNTATNFVTTFEAGLV